MEPVQGYLTKDGTFYESKRDARLHEATREVTMLCESHTPQPIAPERFLLLLSNWGPQIREFIDANQAIKDHTQEDTSPTSGNQTYDELRDALDETVEQQPTSGRDDLPDVGDSSRPQGVSQRKSKHGSGVRRGDA